MSAYVTLLLKFGEHWNQTWEWLQEVQLQKDYYVPYFEGTEPLYIEPMAIELWNRMPNNEWIFVKESVTSTG
ncbi:hypothetical protein ACN47E_002305 [Coniothyrium glycines]